MSDDLDPIGIVIRLSELRPVMTVDQAERESEVSTTMNNLAVRKIIAASRGDKNKFNLISKQQTEVARLAVKLIEEVCRGVF